MNVLQFKVNDNCTERSYTDIDNTLKSYQSFVGGMIETLGIASFSLNGKDYSVVLICNEEGKLIDLPFSGVLWFSAVACDDLAGNFLLALADNDYGDFVSMPEWVKNVICDVIDNCVEDSYYYDYDISKGRKLAVIEADVIHERLKDYVKEYCPSI